MLKHKGYTGKFEYDNDRDILFGRVIDVDAVVTFYGRSIKEVKRAFVDSVETHSDTCEKKKISPKKSFSGNIRLIIAPKIHRMAYLKASGRKERWNPSSAENGD